MATEYEPAPEGHYRRLVDEYGLSREAHLPNEQVFRNCAFSTKCMIDSASDQTHLILDGTIPSQDLIEILKQVERDSLTDERQGCPQLKPYMPLVVEQCIQLDTTQSYERFYKGIADRILASEIFGENERYRDLAKWMKNNFEHFFYNEEEKGDGFALMLAGKKDGRREQAFLVHKYNTGFVRNLQHFIEFEGFLGTRHIHPILHLGSDAPVYTPEEAKELIARFSRSVKGIKADSLRGSLDGEGNSKRLNEVRANFLQHCQDPKPEELMTLANTANTIYQTEWRFMYQGAPRDVTLVLPRWVITLEEAFAGDWQGSFHPLLRRGCNKSAYNEEAGYISYIRC
jgi:hypothetical protein